MRRMYLVLGTAVLATVSVCSTSNATWHGTSGDGNLDGLLSPGSITVDGNLNDWGVATPGFGDDLGNVWAATQGAYVWEDNSNRPGPGVGGQNFDAEALYTGFDASTNTLYVGLVTGFDIAGEVFSGDSYYAGDIFIDFGLDYDQTGRDADGNLVAYDNTAASTRWDLAFVLGRDGSYTGNVADASSTSVDVVGTPNFTYALSPQGNPGYNSGPLSATGGTSYGTAAFAYQANWGGGNRNVYEFGYTLTGPQGLLWRDQLLAGGWTVHWTMSCGNDFLDVGTGLDPNTPLTPVVPVPAAAPMILLGMGAIAFARRFRRVQA